MDGMIVFMWLEEAMLSTYLYFQKPVHKNYKVFTFHNEKGLKGI